MTYFASHLRRFLLPLGIASALLVPLAVLGGPGLSPTPAAAEESSLSLPVSLDKIELLPIREIEWAILLREHPDLVKRLMFLGSRLEKIHGHLLARSDPQDAGSRKLQQEIVRIASALAPHLDRLLAAVEPLGIDDEVLSALEAAPTGPKRAERYGVRIVGTLPDAVPSRRALLDRLVPAVDAALLTLEVTRRRFEDDPDLQVRLDAEMRAVQKRFWRVIDSTLDRDERIWVRRRLPTELAKMADFFGHLYTLPDLEVSQASRLKSILVRIDAEAAPDKAVEARAKARLAEGGLSDAERARVEQEKQEAEARNIDRFLDAWREGLAVMTEDQRQAFDSILPLLTPQDRPGDLEVLIGEIELTEAQYPLLADLHRRYGPVKGRLTQELAKVALLEEKYGPDSPQRETMDVMKAQAFAEALVDARKAARELFLDVLTPDQVTAWVLGVPKGAKD